MFESTNIFDPYAYEQERSFSQSLLPEDCRDMSELVSVMTADGLLLAYPLMATRRLSEGEIFGVAVSESQAHNALLQAFASHEQENFLNLSAENGGNVRAVDFGLGTWMAATTLSVDPSPEVFANLTGFVVRSCAAACLLDENLRKDMPLAGEDLGPTL